MYKIKHKPTGKFLKKGNINKLISDTYGFPYYFKMMDAKDGQPCPTPYKNAIKGLVCSCVLTDVIHGRSYELKKFAQEVVNELNYLAQTDEWELVVFTLVEDL